MTDMNLSDFEKDLHELANYLTEANLATQLEQANLTLDFLLSIENKTESDEEKVENARKVIAVLQEGDYKRELCNTFAEHYSKMDHKHIARFLEEIAFERAAKEIAFNLNPVLIDLSNKYIFKQLEVKTLQ